MKKRILACFLVIVTLLALCIPVSSDEPAAKIFFVAYNDTMPLALPFNQWVYYAGDEILVSHNVFSVGGLDVSLSVDEDANMLRLYNRSKWLKFEMEEGTVTREDGTQAQVSCIIRNNALFVPLDFCTRYFDLQYSFLTSMDGYKVLRLTNGQQFFSDTRFIERAENLINIHVQNYEAEQETQTPEPPQERPVTGHCAAYLTVVGAQDAQRALPVLKDRGVPATFFLTAEEITEHRELVLEIASAGYPVGLTVEEGETENISARLAEGNEALDAVLHHKTLRALLTGEQKETVQDYCIVDRDLAVTVYEAISTDAQCLLLCGENTYQNVLLLSGASAEFRFLRETSPF